MTNNWKYNEPDEEILSCPFCGSKETGMNVMSEGDRQIGYIVCINCEAQGPLEYFDEITKSWNRRSK